MTHHQAAESWLTGNERKRVQYADDPYFWEGWASFLAACSGRPADAALRRLTFLLVKPESIVGRRIAPILDFLRSHGYRITGTWPVRMGRHEARALWRYQLNTVPIAHIRALELLVTAGELFLLGLDHPPARGEAGAAQSLSQSKGSSAGPDGDGSPAGESLRGRLRCPALMLNFAHAPDEPADVVRELAVLCDAGAQQQVIGAMLAASRWPDERFAAASRAAAAIMTSRYARSAAHDLDVVATLRRMRAALHRDPAALPPVARAAIEQGMTPADQALTVVRALEQASDLPRWDRIVTAAHLVDGLRTGRHPLI
jgi:hypothetical protein